MTNPQVLSDERMSEVLSTAYGSPEWTMDDVRAARAIESATLEAVRGQEPLCFINAGHVHELQQGRLPYGYVYPAEEVGASVPLYPHPSHTQPPAMHTDGWLQDGGLLYRLTDERRPQNRDEINVTMADGSRSPESRARRAGELLDRIRATKPPAQAERAWQPIETAPESMDKCVVVRWTDSDGNEQHEFDYTEDGCWVKWHEHAEHVEMIGGHGVSYTAPYEDWMPLPPPPAALKGQP